MIDTRVKIIENNLPRFNARLRPAIASAMRNGMINFLAVADPPTPVHRGFLKGNKTHRWPTANYFGGLRGTITYNQAYAGYVHDGTQFMEGRPWAADASDVVRDDYVNALKEATEEAAS